MEAGLSLCGVSNFVRKVTPLKSRAMSAGFRGSMGTGVGVGDGAGVAGMTTGVGGGCGGRGGAAGGLHALSAHTMPVPAINQRLPSGISDKGRGDFGRHVDQLVIGRGDKEQGLFAVAQHLR